MPILLKHQAIRLAKDTFSLSKSKVTTENILEATDVARAVLLFITLRISTVMKNVGFCWLDTSQKKYAKKEANFGRGLIHFKLYQVNYSEIFYGTFLSALCTVTYSIALAIVKYSSQIKLSGDLSCRFLPPQLPTNPNMP